MCAFIYKYVYVSRCMCIYLYTFVWKYIDVY